ncbi:hypothetical protein A2Z67_02740 [Candidatus Woesebacteria bacterium RBG_13_36_22]|uniref:Uncharacterized protein n=1 Tax=Candidatus Woesebacteria bacterium RBG_13_36_22 TaxID=1802478 RepID=A0A1F7X650_9BACT|nr:MAG: hypothetical protein A2Z67_02740 [Candidatus Woesebacteria bacterium RBG_13_36_22]
MRVLRLLTILVITILFSGTVFAGALDEAKLMLVKRVPDVNGDYYVRWKLDGYNYAIGYLKEEKVGWCLEAVTEKDGVVFVVCYIEEQNVTIADLFFNDDLIKEKKLSEEEANKIFRNVLDLYYHLNDCVI